MKTLIKYDITDPVSSVEEIKSGIVLAIMCSKIVNLSHARD